MTTPVKTKKSVPVHRTRKAPVRRATTRRLTGAQLYAQMAYRLSLAILATIVVLHLH